jgi:GNAT superfamily N-acetyltransferase
MPLNNPTTALQQKIEQDTGLRALRVSSPEQLETLLSSGLAQLYKEVFAGPPYNEKFELEEVQDIFRDFQDKKGIIFVAQDPKANDRPVAFVVSVPLRMEFELAKIAREYYADPEKAAYFAEDGVAKDYRRRGLSGRMKQLLLETNSAEGCQQILLRTSTQNYLQISAVNKSGGNVLRFQFQKVIRRTTTDEKVVDNNLFYLFNAATGAELPKVLDRVIVVKTRQGDKAFVFNTKYGAFLNTFLTERIKYAYSDIRKVVYVGSRGLDGVEAGKVMFDGRMYINRSIGSRSSGMVAAPYG